jgi:hypothetical protein
MSKPPPMITLVVALLLAGCAAAGSSSDSYHRSTSRDESWNVGATHPRYDTLAPCDGDPNVESAVVRADLPSSHLGMRLLPNSTEEDAVL